ncbi:hypothetical protein PILCRDRAFT_87417 [Piloderma croceum F 1598]|uniref:Mitochondrial DNA polymerase catalytic subunit n=1 Tax=Piloderma croceum (strain F 1598) TaxID=765440 RepID=A0A0C3BDU6_PILCF|nr:hypothetical protein PILCRDRAFT_87417 [Piloderma croceum F 1598]
MKFAQDGTKTSPGDEAKEALDMNAQCSYWISARDRILNQNVVWQDEKLDVGFKGVGAEKEWGVIIPQKTWLTASNAKKNRVGSELKAMVRAPDGYAIVGADVDSEELCISSCMGDAQFGLHGATAIGWMTLDGTKTTGTDLHSKTAGILGISRDQAKVFNYSRIYGAGMRHAVLLFLQSNASMLPDEAQELAKNLYASTKGKSTQRMDMFGRKFWFGGTDSYLFNKLEEIALSDRGPQTPALGYGVTDALSKEFLLPGFGTDYMTSRGSSGVGYLHLHIVAMNHITKYDIKARYLISVHDELRYLVKEDDKYCAALALQIASLWTRSLFAYKLGMDDLPQGVAFFSAVDVDKVLELMGVQWMTKARHNGRHLCQGIKTPTVSCIGPKEQLFFKLQAIDMTIAPFEDSFIVGVVAVSPRDPRRRCWAQGRASGRRVCYQLLTSAEPALYPELSGRSHKQHQHRIRHGLMTPPTSPQGSAYSLHPLLVYDPSGRVRCDVSRDASSVRLRAGMALSTLDEFASNSSTTRMVINIPSSPWKVEIVHARGITVRDILAKLCETMNYRVGNPEFLSFDQTVRNVAYASFNRRNGTQFQDGLNRFDFLGGNRFFVGLTKARDGYSWDANFASLA